MGVFSMKKAAVFILLGQSNAVGHRIPMTEEDKITVPLKNVFGLHREPNQSFDITELIWSGYTSAGMNLAETQDDTYSVANCLASKWQAAIDGGASLPDLYIVQIAIGAQGITKDYMWYPQREKKLIPGKLWTVDISLYPFTTHILSLLPESLRSRGVEPEYVGIHWRGCENDMRIVGDQPDTPFRDIFTELLSGFRKALKADPPIVIHRLIFSERAIETNPTGTSNIGMDIINQVFDAMAAENPKITIFDPRNAPHYILDERQHGILMQDAVHFNAKTNQWVAECILNEYMQRK